ncbi:MAG: alanine dehydrogenase [Archaeoglobaceae archaeon]
MDILWINGQEVKSILLMKEVIENVERAFRYHGMGRVEMPSKIYLYFKKHNGDLRVMPTYIPDLEQAGVKIVNVHPDNKSKGFPTVMGTYVLNDPSTGAPLAVMNATYLTDMRTGAAGGIAAKYLARKDSKVLGLIGSGRQAMTQLLATSEVMDIERVLVSSRNFEHCQNFKKIMEKKVDADIEVCKTLEDACKADIVATTTPVREPIIRDQWIEEGTHINAIGADAPFKQELDPDILKKAKVVVDSWEQASHSGEINVPISKGEISRDNIHAELGEIVAGKKHGRESDEEITVFDSTGLAIQDVATATLVYKKAIEDGVGTELRF